MLPAHLNECEFNPKKPVHCELGCGQVVPKDELKVCIVTRYISFVNELKGEGSPLVSGRASDKI